jgi:hypothetical protein
VRIGNGRISGGGYISGRRPEGGGGPVADGCYEGGVLVDRWSPDGVPDLLFWIDASEGPRMMQDVEGTPSLPGDPVGRLMPSYGPDVFNQAVAGSRPTRTSDGRALSFDGVNDEMLNSERALLRGSITRVAWCRFPPHRTTTNPIPFSQRESSGNNDPGWFWRVQGTETVFPRKLLCAHTGGALTVSSVDVPEEVDVFLAWSYSTATGHRLYIDGELVGTNVEATQPITSSTIGMRLGRGGSNAPEYASNLFYRGGIYNRALTDAEVLEVYERSRP